MSVSRAVSLRLCRTCSLGAILNQARFITKSLTFGGNCLINPHGRFPRHDYDFMAVSCHSRGALCLALMGQLVATFGLPIPSFGLGRPAAGHVDSACGCSPSDRAVGRCCCSLPKANDDACSSPNVFAVEEPSSCCAKHKTSPSKHEESSPVKVLWFGSIMTERCRGSFDRTILAIAPLSFPPEASRRWSFDPDTIETLQSISENPVVLPAIPDVPPPR
jgi:hypothetical protein